MRCGILDEVRDGLCDQRLVPEDKGVGDQIERERTAAVLHLGGVGGADPSEQSIEFDASIDPNDFNDAESCFDFDDDQEREAFQIDEEGSDSDDDMSSYDCEYQTGF